MNDKFISGKYVNLRDVEIEDADFIIKIRSDEKNAACFLKKFNVTRDQQIAYIKKYKQCSDEYYFIIESKSHTPLGTISIYNIKDDTFTSGRWVMEKNVSAGETIEGELLMKKFAFEVLKLKCMLCDVLKKNKKVLAFHKFCGARQISEDENEVFFSFSLNDYIIQKQKMEGFL